MGPNLRTRDDVRGFLAMVAPAAVFAADRAERAAYEAAQGKKTSVPPVDIKSPEALTMKHDAGVQQACACAPRRETWVSADGKQALIRLGGLKDPYFWVDLGTKRAYQLNWNGAATGHKYFNGPTTAKTRIHALFEPGGSVKLDNIDFTKPFQLKHAADAVVPETLLYFAVPNTKFETFGFGTSGGGVWWAGH